MHSNLEHKKWKYQSTTLNISEPEELGPDRYKLQIALKGISDSKTTHTIGSTLGRRLAKKKLELKNDLFYMGGSSDARQYTLIIETKIPQDKIRPLLEEIIDGKFDKNKYEEYLAVYGRRATNNNNANEQSTQKKRKIKSRNNYYQSSQLDHNYINNNNQNNNNQVSPLPLSTSMNKNIKIDETENEDFQRILKEKINKLSSSIDREKAQQALEELQGALSDKISIKLTNDMESLLIYKSNNNTLQLVMPDDASDEELENLRGQIKETRLKLLTIIVSILRQQIASYFSIQRSSFDLLLLANIRACLVYVYALLENKSQKNEFDESYKGLYYLYNSLQDDFETLKKQYSNSNSFFSSSANNNSQINSNNNNFSVIDDSREDHKRQKK